MNWFNKITFGYVSNLLKKGSNSLISIQDFDPVEDQDNCKKSKELLENFDSNLRVALWRTFGFDFALVGFGYFLEIGFKVAGGYMLGMILKWFQQPEATVQGYYYALGLVLVVCFHSFLRHIIFFNAARVGMQVRVSLTAAIYKKCLSLSTSHTSSTGAIVNLIANDVQKFEDCAPWFHFLWVSPIELGIVWYFIYLEIGLVAFAPFITLALMFPLQGTLARQFGLLRRKTVKLRDEWLKSVSDMISGVLIVKLYAWEIPFIDSILNVRSNEIQVLKNASLLQALNYAFSFSSSAILGLATFLTFHYLGGTLTPSKVFTVFTYLNTTRVTMVVNFPKGVQQFFESLVSLERIEDFLKLEEMQPRRVHHKDADHVLVIENASFSWGKSYANSNTKKVTILKELSLKLKQKSLVAVCGRVASGKSSFLQAILGEMELDSGEINCATNSIAYVTQSAWILSGTIKENILFGKDYEPEWFEKVIHCCALNTDLDGFPHRENTIIGEKGVTLSGGQRARLSVARAVYANADLYLLDDPLSALDTKTSRHMFEECFKKVLKDKTVILVTHQIQYLPQCDATILMEQGKAQFLTNIEHALSDSALSQVLRRIDSETHSDELIREETAVDNGPVTQLQKGTDLVTEKAETGHVTAQVYWNYFRSGTNLAGILFFLVLMTIGQSFLVATDLWMARWSSRTYEEQQESIYPFLQIGLAVGTIFFVTCRVVMFFLMCVSSSKHLFINMLHAVSRSPMSFFQSNPQGRIINRFSKDTSTVDEMLPQAFFDFFSCMFFFAAALILTAVIVPYSLLIFPFLTILFLYLRRYYLSTSRQVKRIEAICRSPVYSSIPSTLEGLSLIRAFGMDLNFAEQFYYLQNEHTRVMITFYSCVRWLGLRLDLMVTLFLAILSFGCVSLRSTLNLNPGMVGLLLSYLMALCDMLQWCVRQSAEAENMMVSTERILEYSRLEPEAPLETNVKPPVGWPSQGHIQIQNLNLEYPSLGDQVSKVVLKEMTLDFQPGKKIGVVGRTGAGKSSFIQALFRIVEPFPAGCVTIDDINTSEIGLRDLRSNLSIIPQEPFCFKGSIRSNLDPFKTVSDDLLWYALEMVGLKPTIENNHEKLDAFVAENGSNWSVGERQLICLARAILRNSKVIVMDEATSSIDNKTDKMIQEIIRTKSGLFTNSTVITIAHRINTIIDYDFILVLDNGCVVEYDRPGVLLQKSKEDPTAFFLRLVNEMGKEGDALKAIALKNL